MHKAIMAALQEYPFEYQLRTAYGFIDGYEVNYFVEAYYTNNIHCQFSFYTTLEKKRVVLNRLYHLNIKNVEYQENIYGIIYIIKSMTGLFNRKTTDIITIINSTMVEALREEKAFDMNYSPISGMEMDQYNSKEVFLPITNFKVRLLNEEVAELNHTIDEANKNFDESPNHYGRGLFGVLLGTLVGLVLMFIFTLVFGMISAWAPIVAIFLGSFLYKKFGGKPDKVMIIMLIVVNLIAMMGFMFILYLLSSSLYASAAGYNPTSYIDALKYCCSFIEGFQQSFIRDMLITFIFCVVGFAANIYGLIKSVKRVQKIN